MFEKLITSVSASLFSSTKRQKLKVVKTSGCSAKGRIRSALLSRLESKTLLSQVKLNSAWKRECASNSVCHPPPPFFWGQTGKLPLWGSFIKKKINLQHGPAARQTSQLVLIALISKDHITSVQKYPNDGAMCHSCTLILLAKRCLKTPLSSPAPVMHWI